MRELFTHGRARVAIGLLVAESVAATQGLVIAAIVPRVVADLHGLSAYSLAFAAFFAAFFAFLPFAGPWADRYGARRLLAIALAIMAAGFAAIAAAPTMAAFVAGRFIEGIGDAIDYAVTFAIVAKVFADPLRARMIALQSAAWIVPAIVAPVLGAYVAMALGWRWAFAAFLPLVGIAAVLLLPVVEARPERTSVDPFGALRALFARATFVAAPGVHATYVALALMYAAFFGADAYVALTITGVRGLPLSVAAACITVAAVAWSLGALAAPSLMQRRGPAEVVRAGGALGVTGACALAAVTLGAPLWLAFLGCALDGLGIGITHPTLSVRGFGDAGRGEEGRASSAMLLAGIAGMLGGVLVCGAPVSLASHAHAALGTALAWTFALAACFAGALTAVAGRVRVPDRTPP